MSVLDLIFGSFNETEVYKKDCDLEKQVEELKSIRNEHNKYKVDKDIRLLELGIKGEEDILYELSNANLGLYVLRDVRIEIDDSVAQIDYVVISKKYTYLIECKNLIGNIKVDNTGQFQREYEYNNKKIKESIFSPYVQATRHKDVLEKVWKSRHNKFDVFYFKKHFDRLYKPLVVLANSKAILDISKAPKDIRNNIIRLDQLVNYIKRDLNTTDSMPVLTKKEMESHAKNWMEINSDKYHSIAKRYIDEVDDLKNKLLEFRKDKSSKRNIREDYVFSDGELIEILNKHPKTKEELGEILSEVKVKFHGEEILDILNKK